jgi:hypothetical protein
MKQERFDQQFNQGLDRDQIPIKLQQHRREHRQKIISFIWYQINDHKRCLANVETQH